ncbi:MAG: HNH endonuclease [Terriglobales bacterium]
MKQSQQSEMFAAAGYRLFLKRTADVFRHLRDRVSEKRDRNLRLIRKGREVPYSLEQFRHFVRGHFPSDPYNAWETNCRYCGGVVHLKSIVWDHEIPLSRGGVLALSNLAASCRDCNAIKGRLVPAEFRALMEGLRTFPEAARSDILGRLRGQHRFIRPMHKSQTEAKGDTSSSSNGV